MFRTEPALRGPLVRLVLADGTLQAVLVGAAVSLVARHALEAIRLDYIILD